jgi:hypothetical protein
MRVEPFAGREDPFVECFSTPGPTEGKSWPALGCRHRAPGPVTASAQREPHDRVDASASRRHGRESRRPGAPFGSPGVVRPPPPAAAPPASNGSRRQAWRPPSPSNPPWPQATSFCWSACRTRRRTWRTRSSRTPSEACTSRPTPPARTRLIAYAERDVLMLASHTTGLPRRSAPDNSPKRSVTELPQLLAVGVGAVALVAEQRIRATARPAGKPPHVTPASLPWPPSPHPSAGHGRPRRKVAYGSLRITAAVKWRGQGSAGECVRRHAENQAARNRAAPGYWASEQRYDQVRSGY